MDAVLFVDDEVNILSSLKRGLIDEEYECIFTTSGKEALEVMKKRPISVIVTDMRMPEMDGLTLLKEVKEKYPRTVRIVLSGYTQLQQILTTINQVDIFKFITKPWKLEEEFKVAINSALEYYRLQTESEELKKSLENKNIAYQKILRNIEEVIANAKADVLIAKSIGERSFEYLETQAAALKSNETAKIKVGEVKKLYSGIMNVAASSYKDIDIKEFLDKVIAELKTRKRITKIDWTSNTKDRKVNIKPDVIAFLLQTIEEHFISDNGKYYLKFICEYSAVTAETGEVELTILVSRLSDNNTAGLKDNGFAILDDKIQMFNTLLNELTKLYNISVSAARVDINIGIKIQLHNIKSSHDSQKEGRNELLK